MFLPQTLEQFRTVMQIEKTAFPRVQEFMSEKKSHEVDAMAAVCAALATNRNVDTVSKLQRFGPRGPKA